MVVDTVVGALRVILAIVRALGSGDDPFSSSSVVVSLRLFVRVTAP